MAYLINRHIPKLIADGLLPSISSDEKYSLIMGSRKAEAPKVAMVCMPGVLLKMSMGNANRNANVNNQPLEMLVGRIMMK
ncbi:MAG: hypothetical protein PHV20_12010 [Bacteroidales bacterium]|nr:hypothetical protein [Bacteroidales bacterium]